MRSETKVYMYLFTLHGTHSFMKKQTTKKQTTNQKTKGWFLSSALEWSCYRAQCSAVLGQLKPASHKVLIPANQCSPKQHPQTAMNAALAHSYQAPRMQSSSLGRKCFGCRNVNHAMAADLQDWEQLILTNEAICRCCAQLQKSSM